MNLAIFKSPHQPGTLSPTRGKEAPLHRLQVWEDKAPSRALLKSNTRLLTSSTHIFLSSAIENLSRKIFAYDKLKFYDFSKLSFQLEGWKWAWSPLTWTDPIQPEEELLNQRKTLYLQTPISRVLALLFLPPVFSYHFHKIYHNKNYMSLLKVTGCRHCRLVS